MHHLQAPDEYINLYGHIPDQKRRKFAAMVTGIYDISEASQLAKCAQKIPP